MDPSYEQQIHERNQSSAEVDALRLLWGGTMKQFTPEVRRFETWLRLIGYVETTRNINDVHRQFIRREGMMLPGELIRYMDRLVTRRLLSQQKAQPHDQHPQPQPPKQNSGESFTGSLNHPTEITNGRTESRSTEKHRRQSEATSNATSQRCRKGIAKQQDSQIREPRHPGSPAGEGVQPRHQLAPRISQGASTVGDRVREQITEMGVLPKNVASQTTTEYIFKAHVGKGGSVQTTPVNRQQLTDIERAEAKECKKGMADSPEDEAIEHMPEWPLLPDQETFVNLLPSTSATVAPVTLLGPSLVTTTVNVSVAPAGDGRLALVLVICRSATVVMPAVAVAVLFVEFGSVAVPAVAWTVSVSVPVAEAGRNPVTV